MASTLTRATLDDTLTTLQNAVSATGNGSYYACKGYATVAVQVSGTFTATVTFEGSMDEGTTWVSLEAYNVATAAVGTTTTAAGDFLVNTAGMAQFRTRVTWTSGTSVTTQCWGVPGESAAGLIASAATGTVTANQGTAGASAWPVKKAACTTGTPTSVASNASSTTVLAANSNRLGASVYADSIGSATLYLLLNTGGTASSSNYSVALTSTQPYFEVPAGYTGAIIGIWSAANGAAKVTEYSA